MRLALISEYPGVDIADGPLFDAASGATTVNVIFRVNLPSEWRRQGESPSGVRSQETIRFKFPAGYPMFQPSLSLREDFTRNLPHIQPWITDGRPVPCIYDGHLDELVHRDGFVGVLNHASLWLKNAALNGLIDPKQGWEPVRRDSLDDLFVADAERLQGLVDRRGGWKFLEFRYLRFGEPAGNFTVRGQVLDKMFKVNPKSIGQYFNGHVGQFWDASLALVAWPGKRPSGEVIICDRYFPETVGTIDGLKERAAMYGCSKELDSGIGLLKRCLTKQVKVETFSTAGDSLGSTPISPDSEAQARLKSAHTWSKLNSPIFSMIEEPQLYARPPIANQYPGRFSLGWLDSHQRLIVCAGHSWVQAVLVRNLLFISRALETAQQP